MTVASQDETYMRQALELAWRGRGLVDPNPMVGAVIVKDGQVISEGWHHRFGDLHAERDALAHCSSDPAGATIYVTLEPCCHWGKTPPCTEAIIEAKISRVVIGSSDPNPLVAGKGAAQLRDVGITVEEGVLKDQCDALNAVFFHYITHKQPYGILKYAMTLDGKIATRTGASRWITAEEARRRVHEDRYRYSAIMVGVGTVLADDPSLTCRLDDFADTTSQSAGGDVGEENEFRAVEALSPLPSSEDSRPIDKVGTPWKSPSDLRPLSSDDRWIVRDFPNPVRVIADTHLRTPITAQVVKTAAQTPTIIATCETDESKHAPYVAQGCKVLVMPERDGHVDLLALMDRLGAEGIDSLIIEGGATLAWSALEAGVVQRVQAYIAPKVFGGASAPSPIGGLGVALPAEAVRLGQPDVTRYGDDLLLECDVIQNPSCVKANVSRTDDE